MSDPAQLTSAIERMQREIRREALKLDRTASVYLDAIRGELRSRQMGEEIKRNKKAG